MDLTGKLIIKVSMGDDIRRIPIHNEDLTYDELILMMIRVFRDQLAVTDDVALKYKDEDGDLITLFDSADLAAAIAYSRKLKLTLFVNGKIVQGSGGGVPIDANIKRELRMIRDRITHILDRLGDESGDSREHRPSETASLREGRNSEAETEVTNGKAVQDLRLESKEFDPLQKHQQQLGQVMYIPPVTYCGVADDQQSVSSQASNKGVAEYPSGPGTPVMPPSQSVPQPHQGIQQQSQQYLSTGGGYPVYGHSQAPAVSEASPFNGAPQGQSFPQQTHYHQQQQIVQQQQPPQQPTQQQQPQQQQPQQPQPPQQQQHPSQQVAGMTSQQMSAYSPYPPGQPQTSTAGPQQPAMAPRFGLPGAVGMPTPNNPYGMGGQRGPTPGFHRYPQAPAYR
jgi:protein TFG